MNSSVWQEQVRDLEHYRRRILVPIALILVIIYVHRVGTGVISDTLMRDFRIERASELGLLSAIYFYTYAMLQLPAGILADYYGPRRVIAISAFISAIGSAAFFLAPNIEVLYAGRFITSFGLGFIYINVVKIYAAWFRAREFGTMSGFSSCVGSIASILATTPLALLVEGIGWRLSFGLVTAATLFIALYCWLQIHNSPEERGFVSIRQVEAWEGGAECKADPAKMPLSESLQTVLTNRHVWPPFLSSAGVYAVLMAFVGIWGVPYFMQVYGMTRVESAQFTALASLGYAVAAPTVGFVSDRIGLRQRFFAVNTAIALGAWLTLTLWNGGKPPVWSLYPICFLMGVGSSAVTLALACAKEVNPVELTGIATGLVNAGPFVGAAIVQPVFGLVLDQYWQGAMAEGVKIYPLLAFNQAFWLCCIVLAGSFVVSLWVKETYCTNIYAARTGEGGQLQ